MNIVGLVSSKKEAEEIADITKVFVVAQRTKILAHKLLLGKMNGLETLKKVC